MFSLMPYLRRANIFSGLNTQDNTNNGYVSDDPTFNLAPDDDINDNSDDNNTNTSSTPDIASKGVPQDTPNDFVSIYDKIAKAEAGPAQQEYRDFLNTGLPNRADFKPTKMNRLAAILTGIGTGNPDAARHQLDESTGYNDALFDYKMRGDRLAKAADLEEKDINNRVKTFRDILDDKNKTDQLGRQNRLTDAQIANYNSQIKDRDTRMRTEGWTKTSDKLTGEVIYTRKNPQTGEVEVTRGPKVDETPDEKSNREVKTEGRKSNIIFGREMDLFNTQRKSKLDDQKDLTTFRALLEDAKTKRSEMAKAASDASNPNRVFTAKALALRDIIDQYPQYKDNIDLNTVTVTDDTDDKTRQKILNLINAKVKQYLGGNNTGVGTVDPRIIGSIP